jgi:hypothetical protein
LRKALLLSASIAVIAGAALADEFIVGKRGANSDYPFRGC